MPGQLVIGGRCHAGPVSVAMRKSPCVAKSESPLVAS
jgi:hypothetical protein